MKDDSLVDCPNCEKPTLKRKIGLGAGIIFKGSGFYETDYKRSSKDSEKPKESSPAKTETKKEVSSSKSSD